MDNCKKPSYEISIEEIRKNGGYYDINGLWNSIMITDDNKFLRERVETFIFKIDQNRELQVYLRLNDDNTYRIPGGSVTKGIPDKKQAYLECKEEARIIVKDMEYTGIHYIREFENCNEIGYNEPDKMLNFIKWHGTYNKVYIGFFEAEYHGDIKRIDQDNDMYNNGKFYLIKDILPIINDNHKPIFDRVIEYSKSIQDYKDDYFQITLEEYNDSTNRQRIQAEYETNIRNLYLDNKFLFKIKFLEKQELLNLKSEIKDNQEAIPIANYQFYDSNGFTQLRDFLTSLNNSKNNKIEGYGFVIPDEHSMSGMIYVKPGLVNEQQEIEQNLKNMQTVDNYSRTSRFSPTEIPTNSWVDDFYTEYKKYQQEEDKEEENKKALLDLGWDVDSGMSFKEAMKMADIIENKALSDKVIKIDENFIFNEVEELRYVYSDPDGEDILNENYIIDKKNAELDIDMWKKDSDHNILFITGLSGSGKSTYARQLAKEENATIIELDIFQCYDKFKNAGTRKNDISMKMVSEFLEDNPEMVDIDFSNIKLESFGDSFTKYFKWLLNKLHKSNERYIIEGIHIMLFIPYSDIKGEPIICIGTSMIKSFWRMWKREGLTHKDFIKYGKRYFLLYKEWERQYKNFQDSFNESYIEEGMLRINKAKLSDENYVKELIKTINNTPEKEYKKRSNIEYYLCIAALISMASVVGMPLGILMVEISEIIAKVNTKDKEKQHMIDCIDKTIVKLRKLQKVSKDSEKIEVTIKKLEKNKKLINGSGKVAGSSNNNSIYRNGYMKISGSAYFLSLAANFYDDGASVNEVKKCLDEWDKPVKDLKNLYFETYLEEIIGRGFGYNQIMEYIKLHEGNANYIIEDTEKASIKKRIVGKTLTTIIDCDSDCIIYCKEDNCCYKMNLEYEDEFIKLSLPQVLQASMKGHNELKNILKNNKDLLESSNESYIEEASKSSTLFHLSFNNLDNTKLQPKIPSNFLTLNGYENNTEKRVCFSPSIKKCLRAMSQNLTGKELYVHVPISNKLDVYTPTIKEVPDSKITGEVWIKTPVKIKCIGKIKVDKASDNDGIEYKYGNNTAMLYDWDYHWVDKINESHIIDVKEGNIMNQKDIYYNKEKFDSGEINLCFITGHSGSGKSTMVRNMSKDNIEYYELDDVLANKIYFSMNNLKEYGDLIYSFFKGPGKKYYYDKNDVKEGKVKSIGNDYDKLVIQDFVKYAISYANSHKNKKYVIEGIWLYCFIEPSILKDYAVYIKGTSNLISNIRAAKRDSKEDFSEKGIERTKAFIGRAKNFFTKDSFKAEKSINKYRSYFSKKSLVTESSLTTKIKQSRLALTKNKSEVLTVEVLNKYKNQYRNLSHIKINQNTNGRIYTKNEKVVAMINTEKKSDGIIWIQGLEVFGDNQGQGFGYGLLDIAVNDLKATHLSVRKTNLKAKQLYENYGFTVYKTDDYMDYMKIQKSFKRSISESSLSVKKRNNFPDEVFGLPEKRKYPMPDKKHVLSAIKLFNFVDNEDEKELAENIKKKMKDYKIDNSHIGKNNRLRKYL